MSPWVVLTDFSTLKTIQWTSIGLLSAVLVAFCAVEIPSLLAFALFLVIILLLGTWWSQSRIQDQLDRHHGSVPIPGIWGLLGVDVTDPSSRSDDDDEDDDEGDDDDEEEDDDDDDGPPANSRTKKAIPSRPLQPEDALS